MKMNDREFFIGLKICPICRKERLFGSEKICLACAVWQAEYSARYYAKNKEVLNERCKSRNRSMYAKRKEMGLCAKCGKRPALKGRSKCEICLEKDRIAIAKRRSGVACE